MRGLHRRAKWLIALVAALGATGRAGPQQSTLMMQFCVAGNHGRVELKQELREIARAEGLDFTDRSAETDAELQGMSYLPPDVKRSLPIMNISARRGDVGFSASSLGLGANQAVIGFGVGSATARDFAKRTLERLQRTWRLVRVPDDRGAIPLKECPPKS